MSVCPVVLSLPSGGMIPGLRSPVFAVPSGLRPAASDRPCDMMRSRRRIGVGSAGDRKGAAGDRKGAAAKLSSRPYPDAYTHWILARAIQALVFPPTISSPDPQGTAQSRRSARDRPSGTSLGSSEVSFVHFPILDTSGRRSPVHVCGFICGPVLTTVLFRQADSSASLRRCGASSSTSRAGWPRFSSCLGCSPSRRTASAPSMTRG